MNSKDITPGKRNDFTDRLLTVEQVAAQCHCSEPIVRKWISSSQLSYVVLGDGEKRDSMIRVRESALIKFWRRKERKAI